MESTAAQQPSRISIGDGGRYALKACLSQSAGASVYAAFDVRLSREVVIKVLKTTRGGADAQAVAHASDLLAGVRLVARLQHPSMVTLFDAGLCGLDVYIAMERLESGSLHEQLSAGWQPASHESLRVGARIAAALAFVHEAGALHGRVEPAHVFFLSPTQLKLLNCGIGGLRGQSDIPAVDALGEPAERAVSPYTAPEVLLGAALDARCDVYGLGLVMYEMLAGRAAFGGDSSSALRNAVLLSDVPEAHALNPTVPTTLSSVVARAMARDPALRHQSMRELLDALKTELGVTSPKRHASGLDRRRRTAAAFAGVLAISAISAISTIGFFVWREVAPPTSTATQAAAIAWNTASVTASAPAPVQARSSAPQLEESVAPNVSSSVVEPIVQIRQAAVASSALTRATPSLPKTAVTAARQSAPRSNATSAGRLVNAVPPAAAAVRQPETSIAAPRVKESAASRVSPDDVGGPAAAARGAVIFAIEPGGAVEINGVQIGTTPPLRRLTLPNGKYEVTIRNEAFEPHVLTISVSADKPVNISHRFGS
jgi:eukaryotic-like serine/threonine-protein kinase